MLRYIFLLTLALILYWLSLSGYFIPMILSFGVISILLVLGLCKRMGILDFETAPYARTPAVFRYFVWLSREIVKANMAVVKAVMRPDMEVSPTMVRIPLKHKTDIARTMFANSITLTPGTVSVDITEDDILVHALLSEMSAPEDFAEMETRAGRSVGEG